VEQEELTDALELHQENMESLEQSGLILFFISVGIVAPLIEEVMFRGIIFDELERKISIPLTVILQGLVFGLYHMNIAQGAYTSVMGIFLGLSLVWTGSIWAPILIHAGNNLFSIFLGTVPINHTLLIILMIASLLVVLPLCIWYLYKNRIDFNPRIPTKVNPEDYLEFME